MLQSVEYRLLVEGLATRQALYFTEGLHYIKMFPVTKQYFRRYRTESNQFATLIQTIIDKNTKTIVDDCQTYLDAYANGCHPKFSTNIDYLLSQLFSDEQVK